MGCRNVVFRNAFFRTSLANSPGFVNYKENFYRRSFLKLPILEFARETREIHEKILIQIGKMERNRCSLFLIFRVFGVFRGLRNGS